MHDIPLNVIPVTSKEQAQMAPTSVTTYALFKDGKFLMQGIQSDKKSLKLAGYRFDPYFDPEYRGIECH